MRSPGIEPGSITWQATIITTRPRALSVCMHLGDWSNGMILASGARGREFDSRITPSFFFFGLQPGGVAQMVERMLSMHEAQGSIPCSSTFFFFQHPKNQFAFCSERN